MHFFCLKVMIDSNTMTLTVTFCVILSFCTSVFAQEPCNISQHLDRKTLHGLNVTSDGSVLFFLMGNQKTCSIDIDSVYHEARQLISEDADLKDEMEVFLEYNFFCKSKTAIHFVTHNVNAVRKLKISVALVFGKCDVYMEELSLFLRYGNIWSILQSNDSMIHVPSTKTDCLFANHIRMISAKIVCSARTLTYFFWESCNQIFENVNVLQLKACKTNHLSLISESLTKKFPKLQTLLIENVNILSQMTFPWTHVYVDTSNNDIVRYLSNETETNRTDTAMGRAIYIHNSNFDVNAMLHLNGNIESVVIVNSSIEQIGSHTFQNVTGLYHIDLSSNKLNNISNCLFENKSDLLTIHLKNNMISKLLPDVFEDQHKLVFLDLAGNLLSTIDPNVLRNQRQLQELHLENNKLHILPGDFLKEQVNSLKLLYLNSNPLKTIPVMPFYGTNIELIDIHSSKISGESLIYLVNNLGFYDFVYSEAEWKASHSSREIGKLPQKRKILDLSFCKIREISLDLNVRNKTALNFLQLLKSYHIKGDGNPFKCNCDLYVVKLLFSIEEEQGLKMDWICMYPQELKGRAVTSLTERDIYCPVNVTNCPKLCVCYVRYDFSSLIVDCRNVNMSSLPLEMPEFPMELWLKNASIFHLDFRDYLLNVSVLDLSENKLTAISPMAASALQNVTLLNLENNDLTSLPVHFKYMNISKMYLGGNSFLCDCHTRWMKTWLLNRVCPVAEWNTIKCTDYDKKVNIFVTAPDSNFVCKVAEASSVAEHVIFPSIVIGCFLFVILVLSLTIYFQRFTVRVLLYMVFGIRICDSLKENQDVYMYDCVFIYDRNEGDFVANFINGHLKESGFRVADMYKDSIIGFTLVEGIKKLIQRSRRVIFCMTKQSLDCDLIITLWNIASERALNRGLASVILIVDREFKATCTEENIRLYIKNGRYLNMDSKLLHKSIEYLMSKKKQLNNNHIVRISRQSVGEFNQSDVKYLCETTERMTGIDEQETVFEGKPDVYVVYPDVVDELHRLTRNEVIPFLRENKQSTCILQDDFVFGEDIRYVIEPKLDAARHVIAIVSNETLNDDVSVYVLTTILTKAFVCTSNYLLLFTYGQINVDQMTDNLNEYMSKYITASVNEPNFKERMLEALLFKDNGDEHNSDREETDSVATDNDVATGLLI